MFQLLIYRRDITDNPDFREGEALGGGFLTMTVDLGVSDSRLRRIRDQLKRRVGQEVDLAPIPIEDGSVRIATLGTAVGGAPALEGGDEDEVASDTGARFVEKILGSAKPSMYGDNRCVFTIELDAEGAQLMAASLRNPGATQIAVIYSLDFKGLLPAYEVKITIDFAQSYNHLRSRFTANTLWFKTDIDSEVERLTKEGHIKIEEVDYLGGGDAAALAERATRLQNLAKELAQWSFFSPGLTPGRVLAAERGTLVAADPTADAQANKRGFHRAHQQLAAGARRQQRGLPRAARTGQLGQRLRDPRGRPGPRRLAAISLLSPRIRATRRRAPAPATSRRSPRSSSGTAPGARKPRTCCAASPRKSNRPSPSICGRSWPRSAPSPHRARSACSAVPRISPSASRRST